MHRPLWKRVARRLRGVAYRALSAAESLVRPGSAPPLPPAHLRVYYYRTARRKAFLRACEDARTEVISRGLRPDHRLLDIGSGIGNLPLGLADYLRGSYDGIEIHPEAVRWCQRAITRKYPNFRFHRADLASAAYNPLGRSRAAEYRFPFPDRSFEFIFLGSVFTHMSAEGVEQYLREIARMLSPGGTCVASYFLVNDESRAGIEAGTSFISFPFRDADGLSLVHDEANPDAAVAIDEAFVRDVLARVGLKVRDVRRGLWWKGKPHDQDVLALEPI